MRHLFVIQCHEYEPAIKLGELIRHISPMEGGERKFEVFYAWDEKSADRKLFRELDGTVGKSFSIGYFTVDQGLYHLLLWDYIDKTLPKYDYYHVISASDLPFRAIFNIDNVVKDGHFYATVSEKFGLWKASPWYGVAHNAMGYLAHHTTELLTEGMKFWYTYQTNRKKYSGSFDEYYIGFLMHKLAELGFIQVGNNYNMRLILFPSDTEFDKTCEGLPIADYGKRSTRKSSPVILEKAPQTIDAYEWWQETLFGRKFEFNSDSYNYFYKDMYEYKF